METKNKCMHSQIKLRYDTRQQTNVDINYESALIYTPIFNPIDPQYVTV